MNDYTLMKFAAIALGKWSKEWEDNWQTDYFEEWKSPDGWFFWNPLSLYNDSFDIFVTLQMHSLFVLDTKDPFVNFSAWYGNDFIDVYETVKDNDVHTATMRAIVRVAAQIGMKKAYNEKINTKENSRFTDRNF